MVAVIDAAVAGALAALIVAWTGQDIAVTSFAALSAFLLAVILLLGYWRRSVSDLSATLEPRFPTPHDQLDRPLGNPGTIPND